MKSFFPLFFLFFSCSFFRSQKVQQDYPTGPYYAQGSHYALSSQGVYTSQAGKKMMDLGGNLFDAFAAMSFTLSVERPHSTGLGGGGFAVFHHASSKTTKALDFREKAPLDASEKMYLDEKGDVIDRLSLDGARASGVPALVAGVLELHEKYGSLSRQQILAPAIELAQKGFAVYPHLARALKLREKVLRQSPAALALFFKADGSVLEVGDWLVQSDLAHTLQLISQYGAKGFYDLEVAQAIVDDQKLTGGLITRADLRRMKAVWREPVEGSFHDMTVVSMPPPSSGGVHVLQILNMLENDPLSEWGAGSFSSVHMMAQAMQAAFVDRAKYLGDADFVRVPVKGLISKAYAQQIRQKFDSLKARASEKLPTHNPWAYESNQTAHFSLIDAQGNAIASTQTINGLFGSGVVIPNTGIVMNNQMDDFAVKANASNLYGAIGGKNNLIAPQKKPLSSMSPTLLFKDGRAVLSLGTPSGTRILTCVAQVILNWGAFGLSLERAVEQGRIHHQWMPDKLFVEEGALKEPVLKQLKMAGYEIENKDLGCRIQAASWEDNRAISVSDKRGAGQALAR